MKTYAVQITKTNGTSYITSHGHPTERRAANEVKRMLRLSFVASAEVIEEVSA